MTLADKLNIAGIVATGVGSTVAMAGVYLQMNGYFAIKTRDIFGQLIQIMCIFLSQGKARALEQLNVDAKLGQGRAENRGKSLLGFYCVLVGFLLQMLGSGLLFGALFADGAIGAKHAGG